MLACWDSRALVWRAVVVRVDRDGAWGDGAGQVPLQAREPAAVRHAGGVFVCRAVGAASPARKRARRARPSAHPQRRRLIDFM